MSIFLTLMTLFPSILQAIIAVEAAFKPPTKTATSATTVPVVTGSTKKQIVLTSVATAAKVLGAPVTPALMTATATLIDTTVASLNSVGLLGKPAPVKAAVAKK